jgi:N-acetylneuraminic acid mutarotase
MSVKRPVYLKQLLFFPALALISSAFFSSCQKVTSATTNIGDWAVSNEYDGATRNMPVCFVINNIAYVGLGFNSSANTNYTDFYKFDEGAHSWFKVADFPGAGRSAAVAFAVNGKGYVTTGTDGTTNFKDLWEFDPTNGPLGTWTRKTDFPGSPRNEAVAFAIGNNGYVISGYDSVPTFKKDMWIYNQPTDTWTQGADLGNNKRKGAVAFVYNGIGYVVTGQNNGTYLNDLWAYNPATTSWTEKRIIQGGINDSAYSAAYGNNILRSESSVFLIHDTAYLTNGTYSSIIGTTWAYDITHDQWFQKTSFEGPARQGGIAFTVNNHGYFGLGSNGSVFYDDLWQFFPDAAQTNSDNN